MADQTNIEWADSTFNPWVGCAKVSAGCKYCYAETLMDHRFKKVTWGFHGIRSRTRPANWHKANLWNDQPFATCAGACGWRGELGENEFCPNCGHYLKETKRLVFCGSLCDIFEDHPPQAEELDEWRRDLWALIEATPNLFWLLLTKRPENIAEMLPDRWALWFPQNIGFGISAENQEMLVERWATLEANTHYHQPRLLFLSAEPLIGPVDLAPILAKPAWEIENTGLGNPIWWKRPPDWVIAGGESGPNARPCHPQWVEKIRDQCREAGIPFMFKQWGEWVPHAAGYLQNGKTVGMFPDGTIITKPPQIHPKNKFSKGDYLLLSKVGKKEAGRKIGGRQWLQFPKLK